MVQTVTNLQPPRGLPGGFAQGSSSRVLPAPREGFISDGTALMGTFAWSVAQVSQQSGTVPVTPVSLSGAGDASSTLVGAHGTGAPLGFVGAGRYSAVYQFLGRAVPGPLKGQGLPLYTTGSFFALFAGKTAPALGDRVYADGSTGAVVTKSDANAQPTQFTFTELPGPDGLVCITSDWGVANWASSGSASSGADTSSSKKGA